MKLLNRLLLLHLTTFIQESKSELNINFQQNDYQIKFERIELVRYNKEFFENPSVVTFKYNRSTPVTNATFTFKIDVGADVVSVVQAYKFMSNEYRLFPLRFGANTCKTVAANMGGTLSGFKRCGNFLGCPMVKGRKYHICNWYPDQSKFPPFIPEGVFKMEIEFLHSSKMVAVIDLYMTIFRPVV